MISFSDVTVRFQQSDYDINEDGGSIQIFMALNNPSLTNITLEVYDTNITATSKVYIYVYWLW